MDIQQECTFKPDLKATKHAAVHQQSSSKFSIIIDKPSEMPYELRDCTFTPKVLCCLSAPAPLHRTVD